MADEIFDGTDVVRQIFREGQNVADEAGDALPHGVMEALDMMSFAGVLRNGLTLPISEWLLLDSRGVDGPMAYNPIVVTLSSLKPFFFNGLQSGGALLGPWWSLRPRNPIRASRE